MKTAIILGTRPEIIKMAPIIRFCENYNKEYFVIHTNQHYSENMDKIFFDELELVQPKYNLGIGSGSHGEMTGRMMIEIEKVLQKENPDIVLVQGDTNTVMAAALVASKIDIKVGHVEAGLRSYDRSMPEEINRIVTDHVSDYLFAPTKRQADILMTEGIEGSKIFTVGNTIVDAVLEGVQIAEQKSKILQTLNLSGDDYILMTAHRPATVDVESNLKVVIGAVSKIAKMHNVRVVFPAHPRTKKMIEKIHITLPQNFTTIDPVGYLDMLMLQKMAVLIATDSGGLQEESCILKKKCIVLRENTERPEAVDVGGCVLVGNSDNERILTSASALIKKDVVWTNPFGDGKSAEKIMKIIANK